VWEQRRIFRFSNIKQKALSCFPVSLTLFSVRRRGERSSIAKCFYAGEEWDIHKDEGKGASIIIAILFYVSEHTISYGKRGEKERETMSEFFQIPFRAIPHLALAQTWMKSCYCLRFVSLFGRGGEWGDGRWGNREIRENI
jgi:hypothetical protein